MKSFHSGQGWIRLDPIWPVVAGFPSTSAVSTQHSMRGTPSTKKLCCKNQNHRIVYVGAPNKLLSALHFTRSHQCNRLKDRQETATASNKCHRPLPGLALGRCSHHSWSDQTSPPTVTLPVNIIDQIDSNLFNTDQAESEVKKLSSRG